MSALKFCLVMGMGVSVSGCVSDLTITHSLGCANVVPYEVIKPVEGTPLPNVDGEDGWFDFGDKQTAQLEKANHQKQEAMEIVKLCEARDRTIVVVKTTPKLFHHPKK